MDSEHYTNAHVHIKKTFLFEKKYRKTAFEIFFVHVSAHERHIHRVRICKIQLELACMSHLRFSKRASKMHGRSPLIWNFVCIVREPDAINTTAPRAAHDRILACTVEVGDVVKFPF